MADCGICLDQLKSPVSIPCGHIHCEKCLKSHISAGVDAMQSTCPTCRATFYIAKPDFAYVPKKYHSFILPSVRKLYFDLSSQSRLTDEISALENRVQSLLRDNDRLMEKCEAYMAASDKHAEGERQARQEAANAQLDAECLRNKYETMKKKYLNAKAQSNLMLQNASNNADSLDASLGSDLLKRKSSRTFEGLPYSPRPLRYSPPVDTFESPEESRPKRALPRARKSLPASSSPSHSVNDSLLEPPPFFRKRPRLGKHPEAGPSSHHQEHDG
ncbi:hypothetical protein BV22DRAFT_1016892 [Leucogyrophana mollusca]|uniref:Uncharacterized protein n=1 Tax=Leucogyrophana mollusca TaxID=85980 RepID=A0ACB8BBH2_9AGAM|nr:hypothetical protein BV22DRAFT_1016892 [Leucogyrophana mollusca]